MIIPFLNNLIDTLEEYLKNNTDSLAKILVTNIIKNVNRRFDKIEDTSLNILASLLDPRFKNNCFSDVSNAEIEKRKKLLLNEAMDFLIDVET